MRGHRPGGAPGRDGAPDASKQTRGARKRRRGAAGAAGVDWARGAMRDTHGKSGWGG